MIGKGNFHAHGVKLAAYLVAGHRGERAELIEMRGFGPVSDLREGFRIEHIRARDGTKADQPFFHVQFRGAHGEGLQLTLAQQLEIADRCDKALGLAGQPRAASLHINRQTGDAHLHLGYSLVAEDGRLFVKKLGLYKNKLKRLSREIERDYGLKIVSSERQPGQAPAADRKELEQSRRLGTDGPAIRATILDALEKSDGGRAFKAALDAQGLMRRRPTSGPSRSRARKHGRGRRGQQTARKSGPSARRRLRSMRHGTPPATRWILPPAPRRSWRPSRSAGRSWSM